MTAGVKNLFEAPSVQEVKTSIPSLYIRPRSMKNFVEAINHDGERFYYLMTKFFNSTTTNTRAYKGHKFINQVDITENWHRLLLKSHYFLGTLKAENHQDLYLTKNLYLFIKL